MRTPPKDFDPNKRAEERENRPLSLGERTVRPRRKTPKVMRNYRKLGREDARLAREQRELIGTDEFARLAREEELITGENGKARELTEEERRRLLEIETRREELDALRFNNEDKLAEIEDRREECLYEMVLVLLQPADEKGELTLDYLTDNVDIEEVRGMFEFLMPDAPDEEPEEDPTTETPASSS